MPNLSPRRRQPLFSPESGGRGAVFVPVDEERYELRWIEIGPVIEDLSTVPLGLRAGTPVVAQGLEVLFAAARDSLERRTQGSVADSIN